MNNELKKTIILSSSLLGLLLTFAIIKSMLFYFARDNLAEAKLSPEMELTFNFSGLKPLKTKVSTHSSNRFSFSSHKYLVNYYLCKLQIKDSGDQITHYWWFIGPNHNQVTLLPAPHAGGITFKPTMVHPDALRWQTEKTSIFYTSLVKQMGSHEQLMRASAQCRVQYASNIF